MVAAMVGISRPPCDPGVVRASKPPATGQLSPARRRLALAATICGSGMAFLDGSVVNVALPAMQRGLQAGAAEAQWLVNAYLLMLGALVLTGGALGDRYGRRRVFVAGVLLFALASLLCALAPDARLLIAARALQGVGAALLTPASLAVIGAVFAPEDRGRAVGLWAGFGALAAAAGPVLGGWLVDQVSWRAIFLINLPLAAATVALAYAAVPETRDPDARRLDWPGAVLAAAAGLAAGVVLLGLFFLVEARAREPMMPLGLYRSANFSGANGLTLLLYFALGGALFFLPFLLISVHGYSAVAAGAALLPFSVVLGLLSGLAGRVSDRIGPRLPLTIGPLLAAAGFGLLALGAGERSWWLNVLPGMTVLGLGMTIAIAPLTSTVLNAVPTDHAGVASGINNAVARVAGLLAIALMGVVFAQVFVSVLDDRTATDARAALSQAMAGANDPRLHAAFLAAYRTAMGLAAACAAASGLVAFLAIGRARSPQN
jgi:MFS family permease